MAFGVEPTDKPSLGDRFVHRVRENFLAIDDFISSSVKVYENVTAMRAETVTPVSGAIYYLKGHTIAGVGSNTFRWDPASTEADNNVKIIKATAITTGRFIAIGEITVERAGAIGDGVTIDDSAFSSAAALGTTILLTAKSNYLLSTRVSCSTGTRFVCMDGIATITLKTGVGGFNSTDLTADKDDAERCVFLFNSKDDIGLSGIMFTTDGLSDRVIYPIRVKGGTSIKGCSFNRIYFTGFKALNGGLLSLNTIGAGSYTIRDVHAYSCGTSSTSWTGTPQITVVEIDNDMVGGVPSVSGYIENISGKDIVFTGSALSTYGQQTDVLNVAGISGTDRKGPIVFGVYGENVGEVVDLFCSYSTVRGIKFKDVYYYGVKLIHGARHNNVEVDTAENWGQAAVGIFGSSSLAVHTQYNNVKVNTAKQSSTIGSFSTVPVIMFGDNGGGVSTCLPKNNTVLISNAIGDAVNLDYIVREGGVANSNNNFVEVSQASGWATAFCDADPGNVKIRCKDGTETHLTLGSAQAITLSTNTTVDFSVVSKDINSESDTANDKIRCKFPGRKQVKAQVRVTGCNSGDLVELRILKNTSNICQNQQVSTGTGEVIVSVDKFVFINENEVSSSNSDISIQIRVTGGGTPILTQNSSLSFLQVTDV